MTKGEKKGLGCSTLLTSPVHVMKHKPIPNTSHLLMHKVEQNSIMAWAVMHKNEV